MEATAQVERPPMPAGLRPIIHVESPLRPQPGDPGWPRSAEVAYDTDQFKRSAFNANQQFAKEVCHAIALAGGIPQAPHLFFPLFLDDFKEEERALGLECGIQSQRVADEVWFVLPMWREEFSSGMKDGLARAAAAEIPAVMAPTIGSYRINGETYRSKFHYHLIRLTAGEIAIRSSFR